MFPRLLESLIRGGAVVAALAVAAGPVPAQPPGPIGQSTEWEATGFNNGRRMVRDSNGYFHAVWHAQAGLLPPTGGGAQIFYARTMFPANEPPSMAATPGAWSPFVQMTALLGTPDNRYPSLAIEYDSYDGQWLQTNTVHVVWQAIPDGGSRYEVLHAVIPAGMTPSIPAPWVSATNLSQTPLADSLVPSAAINLRGPTPADQHVHVAWQEEDVNNNAGAVPPPHEDAWFSDIAYVRSVDGGASWQPPAGGWDPDGPGPLLPYPWDNVTQSPQNSQMPSLACVQDSYAGSPAVAGRKNLGYNTQDVNLAYHEDVPGGINVFFTRSTNDGATWGAPQNVSLLTFAPPPGVDAYPSLASDMLGGMHITFMRNNMIAAEPLRTGGFPYSAGFDPSKVWSFPGPDVGMYGVLPNIVMYAWFMPGGPAMVLEQFAGPDLEFPTVALDRRQHVTVNWQQAMTAPVHTDYEIMRSTNLNGAPPLFPPVPQVYAGFTAPVNDSTNSGVDDLFPNLAAKKTAMYFGPPPEPANAGFDEVWTTVPGHGAADAMTAQPKFVLQSGNMSYDATVPVTLSVFSID